MGLICVECGLEAKENKFPCCIESIREVGLCCKCKDDRPTLAALFG